jgi:hypothetical protein
VLGKSSRSASTDRQSNLKEKSATMASHTTGFVSEHLNGVSETFNDIVGGLVGVFSERLQLLVADAVPGFREQYENIKQRDSSSVHGLRSTVGR